MAEVNSSSLVEIQGECRTSLQSAKKQVHLFARRRCRLSKLLRDECDAFTSELDGFPALPKNYQVLFGEFKQSFDLFLFQMQQLCSLLEQPIHFKDNLIPPKDHIILDWEEYRDDLLDSIKDYCRGISQREKDDFLAVLQILDTAERLEGFIIPETNKRGKKYQQGLEKLTKHITHTNQSIMKALHRRKIHDIPLFPGDYPLVEITKIIHREDNQTTDDIIINQIAEKGYTWKTGILRKAAVIVRTQS